MGPIEQILAASGVIVLLAATLWWLRRRGFVQLAGRGPGGRSPRQLEQIDRLLLGPQHSLHLVRVAGRAVLVGRSPAGLALLENSRWRGPDGLSREEGP